MSAQLTIETRDKELPLLLLYASDNASRVAGFLEKKLKKSANVVLAGGAKSKTKGKVIEKSKTFLIRKINEKIDYAVLLVSKPKEKSDILLLLEKFDNDHTKFAIIIPVDEVSNFYDLIIELKKNKSATVLLLGDIFGASFTDTKLSKLIKQAILERRISFSEDDLYPMYPISDTDLARAVHFVLFGRSKNRIVYALYYQNPQTFLSFIYALKRVEPELVFPINRKKNFAQRITRDNLEKELISKIVQSPGFLDSEFQGFEKSARHMENVPLGYSELDKEKKGRQRVIKKIFHPSVFRILLLLSLGLFLETVIIMLMVASSVVYFQDFKQQIAHGDIDSAQKSLKNAYGLNMFSGGTIGSITLVASSFDHGLAKQLYQSYSAGISLAYTIVTNMSNVTIGGTKVSENRLTSIIADSIYAYFLLQEQSVISQQTISQMGKIVSVMQVMPEILGFDSDLTYLILFQDNGELRPTGGFIGSVGELSVKKGSIKIQNVQDVYDLDGQLKGHVEPPFIERRYLQPHLYLRESNFNPNFEISASTSAFLYSLESGKKVNGVIGIDFEVIHKILDATGPIYLNQNSNAITSKNVFDFLQTQIEDSKFPGSRVKKDLLNQLMAKIMLTFENNKVAQIKVLALLPDLLKQKHILISVEKPGVNAMLAANGFTGNLKDTRLKKEGDVYDVFGINEANIGVNKANTDIKRSVEYFTSIGGSKKSVRASLQLDNIGDKSYRAYVRFITPSGAVIDKILIDGEVQKLVNAVTDAVIYESKNFVPPAGLEVDRQIQDGKQFTGFLINVPAHTKQDIIVSYDLPIIIAGGKINYSLLYFTQPGTLPYSLTIRVAGDGGYAPQGARGINISEGLAQWEGITNGDQEYLFTLINL